MLEIVKKGEDIMFPIFNSDLMMNLQLFKLIFLDNYSALPMILRRNLFHSVSKVKWGHFTNNPN